MRFAAAGFSKQGLPLAEFWPGMKHGFTQHGAWQGIGSAQSDAQAGREWQPGLEFANVGTGLPSQMRKPIRIGSGGRRPSPGHRCGG